MSGRAPMPAVTPSNTTTNITQHRWILEGELQDPHHEFFVACVSGDPTPATAAAAAAPEGYGDGGSLPFDERLWHYTYCLRRDMVPKCVGVRV